MTDNTPTTKQDEGGKLLPCPLCGGPAERYTVLPQPGFENRQVQCRQCGCSAFDLKWQCRAPATPPHNEDGLRKAFIEGAWAGWRSGLAGEQMDDDYARRSFAASDTRQALGDIPSG